MPGELPGLEELIAQTGIDPTEWEFRRLCDSIRQIDEWDAVVRSTDKPPPEFSGSLAQAKRELNDMRKDVLEECKSWRDYRIPKRKAIDMSGKVAVPIVRTQDDSDVDL